ncbi:retrovirus-related Pol polyprotein from transposon opus [Trichonephila clavipes]|nr:retrovirus-related Pol polyprotein from transposon opus [Trichonephila clavipes]
MDSKKLEIAKHEFKFVLDNDIHRPSKSPWVRPPHLVNKKDGSVRTCGDYRLLHAQTIPGRYPMPQFVFPYLDDILVASENEEQHKTHLKLVFDRLQKHGLRMNTSKSTLGVTHLEFLGYLITHEGSKPLPEKVDAILSDKLPETIHHKPITYAFHQKNEKASPRQLRHLQYISQFSTNICHIKGEDNLVADAFSRIEAVTVFDYDAIADKQTQDAELQQLMRSNFSVKFKSCTLPSRKTLWCDISTSNIRPYIPKQFRQQIFQQIHGFSHPGIRSTIKLMTEKFIWPNMKKEIREWARTCISCQKCKIHRHTKSKFGEYEAPDTRFSVIHVDLIGPLPPSQGMTFCMTCIDRFSCWMEAVPLPDCKAETASKAFYEHWVCRFGVPAKIITDQGRTLKGEIKAHNNIKWTETLPTILLGLRTALRPDTNHTVAQMVYGSNIRLPGEFFNPPSIQIVPETFVTT